MTRREDFTACSSSNGLTIEVTFVWFLRNWAWACTISLRRTAIVHSTLTWYVWFLNPQSQIRIICHDYVPELEDIPFTQHTKQFLGGKMHTRASVLCCLSVIEAADWRRRSRSRLESSIYNVEMPLRFASLVEGPRPDAHLYCRFELLEDNCWSPYHTCMTWTLYTQISNQRIFCFKVWNMTSSAPPPGAQACCRHSILIAQIALQTIEAQPCWAFSSTAVWPIGKTCLSCSSKPCSLSSWTVWSAENGIQDTQSLLFRESLLYTFIKASSIFVFALRAGVYVCHPSWNANSQAGLCLYSIRWAYWEQSISSAPVCQTYMSNPFQ